MNRPLLILVTPDIETQGKEHSDLSISLSVRYQEAVINAGGLPLAIPATISRECLAACVKRCDGVLLTGGDDIDFRLYVDRLPQRVSQTVNPTPDGGQRDLRELLLIDEVFRQRKPLLAICRGHQLLNIALGGTLVADIPSQRPRAINHSRLDQRSEVVHEVRLTPGSLLAKIACGQRVGVNSTHHQAVARVAAPLRVTALSDDGIIEGLELKPGGSCWLPWLLSVQFHPERLVDRYPEHQAIFAAFVQACAQTSEA
ncbi:MAG TPA: gamma-glutamyl-gamma-aminobutyrate hydrolase family protein [Clostridia bacterium]|nr:gamma-glutamyl-gamma-aminobutyrate hydrolase family protein [Clostridia bacterium]